MDLLQDAPDLRPNTSLKAPNRTDNSPQLLLDGPYHFDYLVKLVVICTGFFCNIFSAVIFRRPVLYKTIAATYLLSVMSISDACYLISAFMVGLERLNFGFALPNGVCQAVLYASYVLRCLCTWLVVILAFFSTMYISRARRAQKHFRSVHCKVVVAWLGLFAGMAFLHLTWMSGVESGMCFPLFGLYFSTLVVMEKIETFIVIILPDVMLCTVCVLIVYICLRRSYFKRDPARQTYMTSALETLPSHIQDGEMNQGFAQPQDRSSLNGEDAIFHVKIPIAISSLYFVLSLPQHVMQVRVIVLQMIYGDFEYSSSPEENFLHDVFHMLSLTRFSMNCVAYALLSASFRANVQTLFLPSRWSRSLPVTNGMETISVAGESEVGTAMLLTVNNNDVQRASDKL